MNYFKFASAILLFSLHAHADPSFHVQLKTDSMLECEPKDPNSHNRFICCVRLAKSLVLDSVGILHLKADPKLCLDPQLQDMKFKLKTGIIYHLEEPKIEDTPFKSYSGNQAVLWIAVHTSFTFPKQIFLNNGRHPFISAPLMVEHKLPNGTIKYPFRNDFYSALGWKFDSEVVLSEKYESYDCSNPFQRDKVCTDRIRVIEETWINELTSEPFKRKYEARNLYSEDRNT